MSQLSEDFRDWRDRKRTARRDMVACFQCWLKALKGESCVKCEPEEWAQWNAERKRGK